MKRPRKPRAPKSEPRRTFDDWYQRVCDFYDSYDAGTDAPITADEFFRLLSEQTPRV